MKASDVEFVLGLRREQARLEDALERFDHEIRRFPRDHKRERSRKAIEAHLDRINRTIKDLAAPYVAELMQQ